MKLLICYKTVNMSASFSDDFEDLTIDNILIKVNETIQKKCNNEDFVITNIININKILEEVK